MREVSCIVCGQAFSALGSMSRICSAECRRARRRAREAGSDQGGLPPPTQPCVICGQAAQRPKKTCSAECAQEKQRRKWRAWYHASSPETKLAALEEKKRRRRDDPAWAKQQDVEKWAREKDDPARREARREAANRRYAARAEQIQAERQKRLHERLEAMTPAERAEYLERRRRYVREHRDRVRADPEVEAHRREAKAEGKRRRREEALGLDAAALARELQARLDGEAASVAARSCEVCDRAVVGRHPSAKTCSRKCQRQRQQLLAKLYSPRPRPCRECGTIITAKTSTRVCSPGCRKARKARLKRNGGDA